MHIPDAGSKFSLSKLLSFSLLHNYFHCHTFQLDLHFQDPEWTYLPTPVLLTDSPLIRQKCIRRNIAWKQELERRDYCRENNWQSLTILPQIWVFILNCTNSSVFKILFPLIIFIWLDRIEKDIQCRAILWMRVCIHVQRFLLLAEIGRASCRERVLMPV